MNICKNVLMYAENLGVHELQPGEKMFNRRNVGVLLIFSVIFISVSANIFDFITSRQYEELFFTQIVLTGVFIGYITSMLKAQHTIQLLKMVEHLFESCKNLIGILRNHLTKSLLGENYFKYFTKK